MTQNPPTDQQLDQIEARANAAEDGWHVVIDDTDPHRFEIHGDGPTHVAVFGGDPDDGFASYPVEANALFAAHARQDVPALLAEVRRLRAELTREQENYQAYRISAEGAKQMCADRLNAVTDLLDQQELAARGFEVPVPEWVAVVRRTIAAPASAVAVPGGEQ